MHTKGPWHISIDGFVRDVNDRAVAAAYGLREDCHPDECMRDRARLIAAAPYLLAALEFYADPRRYDGPNTSPIEGDQFAPDGLVYRYDVTRDHGRVARAAIARAKGDS